MSKTERNLTIIGAVFLVLSIAYIPYIKHKNAEEAKAAEQKALDNFAAQMPDYVRLRYEQRKQQEQQLKEQQK